MSDNYGNLTVGGRDVPVHSVARRWCQQKLGTVIPNEGVYIASGTLEVAGSLTGSATLSFDTFGFKVRRVEVFHSGSAQSFDVSLESSTPNTGSFFDPRNVVTEYNEIKGSDNYTSGIDQIEDMVALTDSGGNLYLKIRPKGAGNNTFKYLLILEAVIVYVSKNLDVQEPPA
jgi:hypothetical protein